MPVGPAPAPVGRTSPPTSGPPGPPRYTTPASPTSGPPGPPRYTTPAPPPPPPVPPRTGPMPPVAHPAPPAGHPPPAGTVYPRASQPPYDQWARNQRPQGTVYGGAPVGAYQQPSGQMETSGSLTGHILSQGRVDEAPAPRSHTARVIVILIVALGTIVVLGAVAGIFFRDALTELLKNLFHA